MDPKEGKYSSLRKETYYRGRTHGKGVSKTFRGKTSGGLKRHENISAAPRTRFEEEGSSTGGTYQKKVHHQDWWGGRR